MALRLVTLFMPADANGLHSPSPETDWLCLRPLFRLGVRCSARSPCSGAAASKACTVRTSGGGQYRDTGCGTTAVRRLAPFHAARRWAVPLCWPTVVCTPCLPACTFAHGAAAPTVRLLIADDVGIGKTIEAGLVLRELIDRGEVDRFAILCPPHLVEQWTGELRTKFDLDAVAVTATSAARLEHGLPAAQTLFDAYPYTVVSLDYIKADKRRDSFKRACPSLVIVDEAHSCVGTHLSRQQRFELLKVIADDRERHLILLTATPHSGDELAFDRLLSLLDPSFASSSLESDNERARLARHFVQRRRADITGKDWGEERAFPKHLTDDLDYRFDNTTRDFHDAVLDYCLEVVESAGSDQRRQRLAFWGTLALMRCVGSSPAAAASALRNRLAADPDRLEEQVFDDDGEEADAVDVEPASGIEAKGPLADLVRQAEKLSASPDPKLNAVIKLLKPLIEQEKVNPSYSAASSPRRNMWRPD